MPLNFLMVVAFVVFPTTLGAKRFSTDRSARLGELQFGIASEPTQQCHTVDHDSLLNIRLEAKSWSQIGQLPRLTKSSYYPPRDTSLGCGNRYAELDDWQ